MDFTRLYIPGKKKKKKKKKRSVNKLGVSQLTEV